MQCHHLGLWQANVTVLVFAMRDGSQRWKVWVELEHNMSEALDWMSAEQ